MKQAALKTFQDIELKNFTWEVVVVSYNWLTNKASVEVHALEDGKTLKHSRTFEFDCPEEWTSETALSELLKLETFEGSI